MTASMRNYSTGMSITGTALNNNHFKKMNLKLLHHRKLLYFFLVLFVPALQLIYYFSVTQNPSNLSAKLDLVLVYSVDPFRLPAAINLARQNQAQYFIATDRGLHDLQSEINRYGKPGSAQILLEGKATTTDQNARFTAPMIRSLPVKTVVLVTSWYHMPRALFLSRLYLLGSPVKVYPFPADSAPPGWWHSRIFWQEYLKFWGSLGRVALAAAGIENRIP